MLSLKAGQILPIELDLSFLADAEKQTCIVFTSGSNARFAISNFLEYLPSTIYSIGPACSKAIENAGKEVKEATISSYEGLLQLVSETS